MEFSAGSATLSVSGGKLRISRLGLPGLRGPVRVDGRDAEREGGVVLLGGERTLNDGDRLVVTIVS
jgi:hypothetical protein